jgi:DNA/RNA-binding domain of Phe-tRNA-synthetase-like protein
VIAVQVSTEIDVEIAALLLHELEVREPLAEFDAEAAEAAASARLGAVANPAPARASYRRFGIDPTRHRPSSEALLRRTRRGDPLPRVNSLVNVANVVSLRLQVPVGLYDLGRVEGDRRVRLGRPGESYAGIGKDVVHVDGRICVADDVGPCGNPSSDSARTMITTATDRAAWIFFLPIEERDVGWTYELVARYGRGLVRVLEAA